MLSTYRTPLDLNDPPSGPKSRLRLCDGSTMEIVGSTTSRVSSFIQNSKLWQSLIFLSLIAPVNPVSNILCSEKIRICRYLGQGFCLKMSIEERSLLLAITVTMMLSRPTYTSSEVYGKGAICPQTVNILQSKQTIIQVRSKDNFTNHTPSLHSETLFHPKKKSPRSFSASIIPPSRPARANAIYNSRSAAELARG